MGKFSLKGLKGGLKGVGGKFKVFGGKARGKFATTFEGLYKKRGIKPQSPGKPTSDKKYIEAIDALTRTLAICPIYYKANLILGTAYLKIRKFENARKHIQKSLTVNKNNVRAYLNLGAVNSILKDYKNGIAMFEKVIGLSPKEASAYMGLAKIYATLDNIEKANFYFRKVCNKCKEKKEFSEPQ